MNNVVVSMVSDATATETRDAEVAQIFEKIRTGKWRGPIERIRSEFSRVLKQTRELKAAKQSVSAMKKKLPGVLWCAQFSSRVKPTNEKLKLHAGLLCADLDDLGDSLAEVSAKLKSSSHLVYLFKSPTNNGLKAVFRVQADAKKHDASFRAVQQEVRDLTGTEIDPACSDVGRLCFVSYDPDAFYNEAAVEIPLLAEQPEKKSASSESTHANKIAPPETAARQAIAGNILGPIRWENETEGWCACPGQHLHTTANGDRDCKIFLSNVPSLKCFHGHCDSIIKGVNHELRSQIGQAEGTSRIKVGSVASEYLGTKDDQFEWPEPKTLPADMPAVPPFDYASLPDTFRPWIEDIAERMQCPPDYVAVGLMTALGSLVGRKVGIRPKRQDDWLVVANLWGCVVGRPGLMKTPALEQPLAPLRRLASEALKRFEENTNKHEVNAMLKVQRDKIAEKSIAASIKKGDEQAARAQAEAILKEKKDEPVCRRYETNDPTIEKLGVLLSENPTGLLLFRDELIGFLRGLDKDGHEGDRATYLEMWNGTGSFISDRIQRGTVRTSAIISILGGIQPDLLVTYVREAVGGGHGADGLLQRFQLFVWPDISRDWHHVDRWPNTEAKDKAWEIFKYLDSLTAEAIGADTSSGIPFLRFSNDAQDRFNSWRAELEKTLRGDIEHPAFEGHLSKYRKLVPALALLIHLASRDTGAVTLAALNKALLWANYLEAHARRIYAAVLHPDTAAARELAKHLQRGDLGQRFQLREIYRKGWAGLSNKDDAEAAIEILCDLGWIHPVAEPGRTTGRPASPMFETNPKI